MNRELLRKRLDALQAIDMRERLSDPEIYAWKVSVQGPWVCATPEQILQVVEVSPKWAGGESWLEWPEKNLAAVMPREWEPTRPYLVQFGPRSFTRCASIEEVREACETLQKDGIEVLAVTTADLTTGKVVALDSRLQVPGHANGDDNTFRCRQNAVE
ncbi:MAG TPA: hypothetical protein VNF68_12835 [Candidatus Baltobacteraceae bacterium]|nr:hypothetical protein [Candidatus Baltobacteraceae bacterium]